ncbi:MAG: hypothetical protein AAFV88_10910 [Planctomycetota bacterium]
MTQVVENHVAALANSSSIEIALVSGGRNDGLTETTRRTVSELVVSALDYDDVLDEKEQSSPRAPTLAREIARVLSDRDLGPDDTILHWHNPTLGKNTSIPAVIKYLSREFGFRQLLQIHDYSEDYRPDNYVRLAQASIRESKLTEITPQTVTDYCYPNSDGIHYATLTNADADVLRGIGIPIDRIEVVPNSVSLSGSDQNVELDAAASKAKICHAFDLGRDRTWGLYPVRGIRRKNVGEFVFLAQLLPESHTLGITLPPTTPIEAESYERWRQVAKECSPKAIFDAGTVDGIGFTDNLAASSFVVSTSAAEGFGMAFLEPWLVGRGVIARKLSNIVDDFEAAGVDLRRFYSSLPVVGRPAWIRERKREYAVALQQAWSSIVDSFGHAFRIDDGIVESDCDQIDFAQLLPQVQMQVIKRVASDAGYLRALRDSAHAVLSSFQAPFESSVLQSNKNRIRDVYCLSSTAEILQQRYAALSSVSVDDARQLSGIQSDVSPLSLLHQSRDFFPCRTERTISK